MSETEVQEASQTVAFACNDCGADLKFKTGSRHIVCDYCGSDNEIPDTGQAVEELDFKEYLHAQKDVEPQLSVHVVDCKSCGATSTLDENTESGSCPYCNTPIVISEIHDEFVIRPKALLPFKTKITDARGNFKNWINKLWFAPTDLKKKLSSEENFKAVYIPYWTFDALTNSSFVGQRGTYYNTTSPVNTIVNGKNTIQQKQVRKVRWQTVSGEFEHTFDDVLVSASHSVPKGLQKKLRRWDLHDLVAFDEKYLSGFITEKYQVELSDGFKVAKQEMENLIRARTHREIGGDQQRVLNLNSSFSNVTFKHVLLPIYISAYRFNGKLYQFLVNGRTGDVHGERPWSALKIVLLAVAIIAVIALLIIVKR